MDMLQLGRAIRNARTASGLSQAELAALAGLSRATINYLENGRADIGVDSLFRVLDIVDLRLDLLSGAHRSSKTPAITSAARSASVSYRESLPPETLRQTLVSGAVERRYMAQLAHLADELPTPLLLRVVREVAALEQVPSKRIWKNMAAIARELKSPHERWRQVA